MSQPPVTSIVILTRNELAYTRACVESIQRLTPEPFEFVFVDNGSTDGTVEYLRGIPGAVVIENDANLGFGGGCNQGIAASTGGRVLLLNNDVVVTEGWLAALHRELDSDAHVGVAGPRSNRVAGVQQVDAAGYDVETLDGLEPWAAAWRDEHRGTSDACVRLVGFCMLVERAVIDRIGGFDLRFGLGNFEDDDFCIRVGIAGFASRIAHDSFIHHAGSRTFTAERIDYVSTMAQNQARFATKWQLTPEEDQFATGSYRADLVVRRIAFDAARHYAPLIGTPDEETRAELGDTRATVLLVCADRIDAEATHEAMSAALTSFGPADDVTVCIRIDPRDAAAYAALESIADALGDEQLPDIVVIEADDANDCPVLRSSTDVVVAGRLAAARTSLARSLGVTPHAPRDLQVLQPTRRAA